ncbi:MAG: hypothetical protein AAGB51_06240 [Planctomycetota bacterium]
MPQTTLTIRLLRENGLRGHDGFHHSPADAFSENELDTDAPFMAAEFTEEGPFVTETALWMLFPGVAIPPGSTIDTAFLRVAYRNNEKPDAGVTINGTLEDDPQPWPSGETETGGAWDAPVTQASVLGPTGPFGSVGDPSQMTLQDLGPDLAAIVQEMLDHPTRTPNAGMRFVMRPEAPGYREPLILAQADNISGIGNPGAFELGPELTIVYTPPGSPDPDPDPGAGSGGVSGPVAAPVIGGPGAVMDRTFEGLATLPDAYTPVRVTTISFATGLRISGHADDDPTNPPPATAVPSGQRALVVRGRGNPTAMMGDVSIRCHVRPVSGSDPCVYFGLNDLDPSSQNDVALFDGFCLSFGSGIATLEHIQGSAGSTESLASGLLASTDDLWAEIRHTAGRICAWFASTEELLDAEVSGQDPVIDVGTPVGAPVAGLIGFGGSGVDGLDPPEGDLVRLIARTIPYDARMITEQQAMLLSRSPQARTVRISHRTGTSRDPETLLSTGIWVARDVLAVPGSIEDSPAAIGGGRQDGQARTFDLLACDLFGPSNEDPDGLNPVAFGVGSVIDDPQSGRWEVTSAREVLDGTMIAMACHRLGATSSPASGASGAEVDGYIPEQDDGEAS